MKTERYLDLPDDVYEKFDVLSDEAYEEFLKKNYQASFDKYFECLELIPEPKKDYGEASNIIEWIVENYLLIKEHEKAKIWVEKLGTYLKNKEILGDWEFLKGRVYFESGDYDQALDNFKIAFQKTHGACFMEQDPKYLHFYQIRKV